jgi:hypothetical protein
MDYLLPVAKEHGRSQGTVGLLDDAVYIIMPAAQGQTCGGHITQKTVAPCQ